MWLAAKKGLNSASEMAGRFSSGGAKWVGLEVGFGVAAHARAPFDRHRAVKIDRQIRNAEPRVNGIRSVARGHDGQRGTRVDAACTGAAAIGRRLVRFERWE